jgi:hypothetical protein
MSDCVVVKVSNISENNVWFLCTGIQNNKVYRLKIENLKDGLVKTIKDSLGVFRLVVNIMQNDVVKISKRADNRAVFKSLEELSRVVSFAKINMDHIKYEKIKSLSVNCAGIEKYNELIDKDLNDELCALIDESNSNQTIKKDLFFKTYGSSGHEHILELTTDLIKKYLVGIVYVGNSCFRLQIKSSSVDEVVKLIESISKIKAEIRLFD